MYSQSYYRQPKSSRFFSKKSDWMDKPTYYLENPLSQVDPEVLANLNKREKDELAHLYMDLNSLVPPRKPEEAYLLYFESLKLIDCSRKVSRYDRQKYELAALKYWEKTTEEVKAEYEIKASMALQHYSAEFQKYTETSETIRNKIDEILARGDFGAIVMKKVSPYRVFKRDYAPVVKAEFPNMKSQERQMIVRERWKSLTDQEKGVYVIKARFQEAQQHYLNIREFYEKRIEFAKASLKKEQAHKLSTQSSNIGSTGHVSEQPASLQGQGITPNKSTTSSAHSNEADINSDKDLSEDNSVETMAIINKQGSNTKLKIFDYEEDSQAFNAKSYFKNLIKDKSVEEVIRKNNEIFQEIRTLDSELQTLVYENYNKFISATDIIKNIKKNMGEIDSELVNLKQNLSKINGSYAEIDNTLKFKWKEIKKLDTLERDLNKLRYLSELPSMFKQAIAQYESKQEGIAAFKEPIRYFEDYSDVLSHYKQTNFMINLYSEIKNYVVRIKTLLSKALEQYLQNPDQQNEEEIKLIIKYLITLGEDKSHLKNLYMKTKVQNIKRLLHHIMNEKHQREINYDAYAKIQLSESIPNDVFDQLQIEVEQEHSMRRNALLLQSFDKNVIKQSQRFQNNLDISEINANHLKKGTCLSYAQKISESITKYILESIEDYQTIFFYDKEQKKVMEVLKDSDEKDFKKFVNSFTQPYLDELRHLMRIDDMDVQTLGQILKLIHKDLSKIQSKLQGVKNLNMLDYSKKITEESIRRQLSSQMFQLQRRVFKSIEGINQSCQGKVDVKKIQDMVQQSLNYLMNDISLTIYQYKGLLQFRNSFMKETQVLSINIFQGLQNLFELWHKLTLAMVNQVQVAAKSPQNAQNQVNESKVDIQLEEQRLRELELIENAEKAQVSGYSIIAYMNLVMKFESFGIIEIYNIIHSMFNEDNEERYGIQDSYNDGWAVFEADILPKLQDQMAKLTRILRKKFCQHFAEKVNFQIRKYFKSYNWQQMVEPRDIKTEFFEICKNLLLANQCLDLLFGNKPQKKVTKTQNQMLNQLKKPELLVKPKKYNAMEMEMDKFLAKKQQIYQNNEIQRYVLMINILHIVLKSLYENVRMMRFNIYGYQQLQSDVYFLFQCAQQVLPQEENNLINGLFNEVMSCCISRSVEFQAMDESVMESMAAFKQQKLAELQHNLIQPPQSASTTTSANSKAQPPKDWLDKVHQEQIFEILTSDVPKKSLIQEGKQVSMFRQFNDNQASKKLPPRMSSQGSSRANAQRPSFLMNKTGQSSAIMTSSENQFSPRSTNSREIGSREKQTAALARSSTQNANRRRSLRQQAKAHNELPEISKINANFEVEKQLSLPSEIALHGHLAQREEQNKENIQDDLTTNRITSSKNLNQRGNPHHSSRLPMKIQRSFQHQNSSDTISSRGSFTGGVPGLLHNMSSQQLEKHIKEVSKQKELLMKLQREKEELEKQMMNNEKIIQNRMQKLHQERKQMEERIVKACVFIQKMARGFIARLNYKKLQELHIQEEKMKLNNVLNELNTQIKTAFNQVEDNLEEAVIKIQTAVRRMIARKNFRISLYKMMLLKNIIENKVHKEKMQMLYAFEQMIINTEDEDDEAYYDEIYGAEDYPEDEYAGHFQQNRRFPQMQRIPIEAEYLSNPSDIIDEEEYEDSEEEKEFEQRQKQQSQQEQRQQNQSKQSKSKVLSKVTANDLMEFAGQSQAQSSEGLQLKTKQTKDQYEIDGGLDMFNQGNLNDTQGSEPINDSDRLALVLRNDSQEVPKNQSFQRRMQPRQQKPPKVLALPPPEPVKPQVTRPLDMERIKVLSQPKTVVEYVEEPIVVKKKAPKPPVAPGQKVQKKKKKEANQESANAQPKPKRRSRRRSKRGGQGGFMDRYERLLRHRESRTSLKMEKQNTQNNGNVLAIEYKPSQEKKSDNQQVKMVSQLPSSLPQREQVKEKSQDQPIKRQAVKELEPPPQTDKHQVTSNVEHPKRSLNQEQDRSFHYQVPTQPPKIQQPNPIPSNIIANNDLNEVEQKELSKPDHTLLYQKCFTNASVSFRDRFPVFADILSKYNKNLKHIANAAVAAKKQ